MKPLLANLRQLYQCPCIWVFHILLMASAILFSLDMARPPGTSGAIWVTVPMEMIFLYGVAVASLLSKTYSKPFSFCLPDHRSAVHKIVLLIWGFILLWFLMITMAAALIFANWNGSIFLGIFALLSLGYWLGMTVLLLGLRFVFIIFLFFIPSKSDGILRTLLRGHPWTLILFCALVSCFIYRALHRNIWNRNIARRFITMPWRSIAAFGKSAQTARYRYLLYRDQTSAGASESTGIFFSERIRFAPGSKTAPHLWGELYLIFGPSSVNWRQTLFAILLLELAFLVMPPLGPDPFAVALMMSIMATFFGAAICSRSHVDLFPLPGRWAYFFRRLVAMLTAVGVTVALLGISVLLSYGFSAIYPVLSLLGRSVAISPINWMLLFIPVVFLPFFENAMTLFKNSAKRLTAVIIVLVFSMAAACICAAAMEHTSVKTDVMIFLFGACIAWLFNIGVLYGYSMRRSLC